MARLKSEYLACTKHWVPSQPGKPDTSSNPSTEEVKAGRSEVHTHPLNSEFEAGLG